MLNRQALIEQLSLYKLDNPTNISPNAEHLASLWHTMAAAPDFINIVRQWQGLWSTPLFYTALDIMVPVLMVSNNNYAISAVDGSQVYPDRHQGSSCFLINIGSVTFKYTSDISSFTAQSIPYFYNPSSDDNDASADAINAQRQQLEFQAAFTLASKERQLMLFDGSLIFWHLESKNEAWIKKYAEQYTICLEQFRLYNLPLAGYISLPHSRELVNLIRLWMAQADSKYLTHVPEILENVLDIHLLQNILQPNYRTPLFASRVSLIDYYPADLKPHFFYLNNGFEIVRIEVPAWMANQQLWIDRLSTLVIDQAIKGRGYPVVLAEAHEQAVIKAADREFFYYAVAKTQTAHQYFNRSFKEIKKRVVSF